MKKTIHQVKKIRMAQMVAAVLVVCMAFTDAVLYNTMGLPDLGLSSKESNDTELGYDYEVIENHLLETSLADNEYTGTNSNYEDPKTFQYKSMEEVEDESKYGIVNILEIVPDEKVGFVGYSIGGCEPLGDNDDERGWIMDAMANKETGNDNFGYKVPHFIDYMEYFVSGTAPALTYKPGKYTGYFKKVDPGHGMYKVESVEYDGSGNVKNVVMYSRFRESYDESQVLNNGSAGYDYVWVESEKDSSGEYVQKDIYTSKEEYKAGLPIYLYDYKKAKYYNNEEFLSFIYPAEVNDSSGKLYSVDGEHGAYNVGYTIEFIDKEGSRQSQYHTYAVNSLNEQNIKAIEMFKNNVDKNGNKGVKVFTRTPKQLKEEEDLIDNVDIIFMADLPAANNADSEYMGALKLHKIAYKGIENDDILNSLGKYTANDNDLTFDQVMRIYKRVVDKQDAVIVSSHHCFAEKSSDSQTNIWKLMQLLYLVNKKDENDQGISGSGREFFKDFMDSYKDNAPVVARARETLSSSPVDLKACDFVKIDETNGNFIASNNYNDWYYEKTDGVEWEGNYDFIQYGNLPNDDTAVWPTSIKDDWLLAGKSGRAYDSNGNITSWWVQGNHFPLYKYYYYYYNQYSQYGNNENGKFVPLDTPSFKDSFSRYKNQMIFNDTGVLFQLNGGGVDLLKDSINDIKANKVVPPYTPSSDKTVTKPVDKLAYMTMNIVNGDSVNKVAGLSGNRNKVMYINRYEFDSTSPNYKNYIPVTFWVRTSHPIARIEVYIGQDTTPKGKYVFDNNNSDELGTNPLATIECSSKKEGVVYAGGTLTTERSNTSGDKNPDKVMGVENVWKYEGTVKVKKESFINKKNTKVNIKVYSNLTNAEGQPLQDDDSITIVTRDFFMLN